MKLMRVTAVDYDDEDELLVQVAGRDEDGERCTRRVKGTLPYLYIPTEEAIPADVDDSEVVEVEEGFESYDGIPLRRVFTKFPKGVGQLAKNCRDPWESDIPYYRRVSISYDLSGYIRVPEKDPVHIDEIETDPDVPVGLTIDPRIFIADIEVLHSGGSFEEMKKKAEDTISHITVWDSKEDKYHVLHLDPEGDVDAEEVSSLLDEHASAESLSKEREAPVTLKRYESEEQLLNGFLSLFEECRPDLVSGWNFIDFDWEYLLSRMGNLDGVNEHRLSDIGYVNGFKTQRKVDCVPAFDMMSARTESPYSPSNWRSSSLDYVANVDLGVGKLPHLGIGHAYENERSTLVAYNIIDVMLCVAIDRKERLHEFFYEVAEMAQIQMSDTNYEMRIVDGYIMSNAGRDEILPPMPEDVDIPANAGGLVLNPSDGVRDWVGVHDLKSLYPSTIITWNISPETIHWFEDGPPKPEDEFLRVPWLPDSDHADGGRFGMDDIDFDVMWTDLTQQGLIPKMLKSLFPKRARFKELRNEHEPGTAEFKTYDSRQGAVKVIMNSFYGIMSNDYWRLGKYGLGDAVTSASRYALWQGKEIAVSEGYEVYYGDTDSIMVSLADEDESKEDALERGHALEDAINEQIDICVETSGLEGSHPLLPEDFHGTDRHCLVYEFEKLYRRFFQAGKKKRYAGLIVWKEGKDVDAKIDTTGFETERSDATELTSEAQPEVIERILDGKGFEDVTEYVQGLVESIKDGSIDLYKVALPAAIHDPLDSYGNTQTAKACRFSNEHLGHSWSQGDDPWLCFIGKTPPMTPGTDVVALEWGEDLPDGYELDVNRTLERALEGPLSPILDEMNWQWEEVKTGAKTASASDDDWADGDWQDQDNDRDNEPGEDWGW